MSDSTPDQPDVNVTVEAPEHTAPDNEVNVEADQVVVNTAPDGGGTDGDVVNED